MMMDAMTTLRQPEIKRAAAQVWQLVARAVTLADAHERGLRLLRAGSLLVRMLHSPVDPSAPTPLASLAHGALAQGGFEWLQLLTHPEIWVYPGGRMGETMRAMLDAEKERRLQQLGEDRIDLS